MQYLSSLMGDGGLKKSEIEWKIRICINQIQPDLNKIEKQTNMFFTDPCYLWGYR